jgi:release factor glutamine methyltransferase
MQAIKDWKVLEALEWTSNFFKTKDIKEYRLDAEVLLAHVLKIKRLELYLKFDRVLNEIEKKNYRELIKQRMDRTPISYIIGKKEFMGLNFNVDKRVLIPRPETELLVEQVFEIFKSREQEKLNIVDTFTGSGNIAISIAKKFINSSIFAIDIDFSALTCAQENAFSNEVAQRIEFLNGNILEPLNSYPMKNNIDIILANPPYILSKDLGLLEPEVKCEPILALDGGEDGCLYYKKLIEQSVLYLKSGGYIFMEISSDVCDYVKEFLIQNGFSDIQIKNDYQNIPRIIMAQMLTKDKSPV